jgi:hypothetical protein
LTRQLWIVGTVIFVALVGTYYLWLSADPSRVNDRMRGLPMGRTQPTLRLTGLAAYAIGAIVAIQYALGLNIY